MQATLKQIGATDVVTEDFARTPAMRELCMFFFVVYFINTQKKVTDIFFFVSSFVICTHYLFSSVIVSKQTEARTQLCRGQK